MATLADLRTQYHADLAQNLWGIRLRNGNPWRVVVGGTTFPVYNNADGHNPVSVVLSSGVASRLNIPATPKTGRGSTSGGAFEACTSTFVSQALGLFAHLQSRRLITAPPATHFAPGRRLPSRYISSYAQFEHLGIVEARIQGDAQLQAALGGDYLVRPDILVLFEAFGDVDLNAGGAGLGPNEAVLSPLRAANSATPLLHASISCKWTMRRDRAQNTRLEALNLVRNRKGRLPHIAAVTMECDPQILASLCLGTGDIDCVYHGALYELQAAAQSATQSFGGNWNGTLESLERMVNGSRLRDISDLPLDLVI